MRTSYKFIVVLILFLAFTSSVQAETKTEIWLETAGETVENETAGVTAGQVSDETQSGTAGLSFGWFHLFFKKQTDWIVASFLEPEEAKSKTTPPSVAAEAPAEAGTGNQQDKEKSGTATETEPESDFYRLMVIQRYQQETIRAAGEAVAVTTPQKKNEKQNKEPLAGRIIVLDAGHGGKDPGAVAPDDTTYEKDLALATARKVAKQLRKHGADVVMTRDDDTFIPLNDRVKISNKIKADAFISLHYNAYTISSLHGIQTFYYKEQDFAAAIQEALADHVSLENRGVAEADYRVLENNERLAVLVELGYLTNPDDLAVVRTEDYQEDAAAGLTAGVLNYFKKQE